ncbi:hypothetical protein [Bordetella genomosp. 13]|uniref:hypothetical protein n=1 Tax=Bordetella genomosp. 13 TaxID=463040 RepID=UPI0011A2B8E2|nr:hypothetical protein [Bordetella genomosp. 13]
MVMAQPQDTTERCPAAAVAHLAYLAFFSLPLFSPPLFSPPLFSPLLQLPYRPTFRPAFSAGAAPIGPFYKWP